jgi:hygromycin-B 7''-O-kinase
MKEKTHMNNTQWNELAVNACAHAGIRPEKIDTIATWDQKYCANAIYHIPGQRYLKIYGPTAERQFHIERSVLRTLDNQSTIPAPHIVAEGEPAQGPPYLIVTGIPGDTAEDIWDDLPRAEQLAIAREIGAITAAIHQLPQQDLASVEQQFDGRHEHVMLMQPLLRAKIESASGLSLRQRDDLIIFLLSEAPDLINSSLALTHFDLAHNHIYLTRETEKLEVAGIIDWGEAMLGPAEWDIAYLWFWTFSGDRAAMRECLQVIYADHPMPQRFARRCMAAVLYTSSIGLLWPNFVEQGVETKDTVREMTASFFPEDIFGAPD